MKYIQQLLEIDAVQFSHNNLDEFFDFIGEKINYPNCKIAGISPSSGKMKMYSGITINEGDYVVKDRFGTWLIYDKNNFELMYKPKIPSKAAPIKSITVTTPLQDFLETEDLTDREAIEILKHWAFAGPGIGAFNSERIRQIHELNFDAKHDNEYIHGQLAIAAVAYALPEAIEINLNVVKIVIERERLFPWARFKSTPENRLKEIVKAGALLAAEYDRILLSNKNI